MDRGRGGNRHRISIETFAEAPGWSQQPGLGRVRRYALEHLDERIDLELAAGIAGLHKSTFCTRFRRSIGIGFPEWLARQRVARALDLLERRGVAVAALPRSLGFTTLRTFQRTFKRIAGTTAGAYKATARPPAPGPKGGAS